MGNYISDKAIIGNNVKLGKNIHIASNCIIEDDVIIGDDTYIDYNCIIRAGVIIGENSSIGANCILGEYQMDFYKDHEYHKHPLIIGKKALIRSGSIIYNGSEIGEGFQTGHQVTIREQSKIGKNVSVGTLSDIQGHCTIGDYVRMHSNVHIGMASVIDDCVWIFPYVVLTNDPTPPSETLRGVHVHSFAIVATNSIIMPGIEIGTDSLVGAGAIVTKDVPSYAVVLGNPAKVRGDVREVMDRETGEAHYPWKYRFDRAMPWFGKDFDEWFSSLDNEKKKMLLGKVED